MHAKTCKCTNTHTHNMHKAIRYRAADSYFRLILFSYSDRPNKSEQHIFIHFSLLLAWGLRHSKQSQQGGAHIPFTVAPNLARQHNTHTTGRQIVESFRVSTHMSTLPVPVLTVIILTATIVYGGEGSVASCSTGETFYLKELQNFPLTDYSHTWHPIIWILLHSQAVVYHQDNIYINLSSQWTVLCALTKRRGTTALMAMGQVNCTVRQGAVCVRQKHDTFWCRKWVFFFFYCKIKN